MQSPKHDCHHRLGGLIVFLLSTVALGCLLAASAARAAEDDLLFLVVPGLGRVLHAQGVLGAAGGAVTVGRVSLIVPPGALEDSVAVQVRTDYATPSYGLDRSGPAYVLELHGVAPVWTGHPLEPRR